MSVTNSFSPSKDKTGIFSRQHQIEEKQKNLKTKNYTWRPHRRSFTFKRWISIRCPWDEKKKIEVACSLTPGEFQRVGPSQDHLTSCSLWFPCHPVSLLAALPPLSKSWNSSLPRDSCHFLSDVSIPDVSSCFCS